MPLYLPPPWTAFLCRRSRNLRFLYVRNSLASVQAVRCAQVLALTVVMALLLVIVATTTAAAGATRATAHFSTPVAFTAKTLHGGGRSPETTPVICTGPAEFPIVLPNGEAARHVSAPFDLPERNWLSGHRGIDIAAPSGSTIVAPTKGVISFAGSVGGKNAVSFSAESGVSFSFEPAIATLERGTRLAKGETLAKVNGHSDHCDAVCVHWGAKRNGVYVDPRLALFPPQIVLKSVL